MFWLRKVWKTARFGFRTLTSYLLHSEIFNLTIYTTMGSKTAWTRVKMTARILTYLYYQPQYKWQ